MPTEVTASNHSVATCIGTVNGPLFCNGATESIVLEIGDKESKISVVFPKSVSGAVLAEAITAGRASLNQVNTENAVRVRKA